MKKIIMLLVFPLCLLLFSCTGNKTEVSFYGMGTYCSATVYGGDSSVCESIKASVLGSENDISHFIPASVISSLNLGNALSPAADISDMLYLCEAVGEKTENKYSIFSLGMTELWDFYSDTPRLPDAEALAKAVSDASGTAIEANGSLLRLNGKGRIDLGSAGKGFACSRAAECCEGVSGAIISVGGSIAVIGHPDGRDSFEVAVRDPNGGANDVIGSLSLANCFVSTSGSYERYFVLDGKTYHHILDSSTGYPYEGDFVSVTVISDSGTVSDVLSTACFLLPLEKAVSLLRDYGSEGIFVLADGSIFATENASALFTPSDGRTVSVCE